MPQPPNNQSSAHQASSLESQSKGFAATQRLGEAGVRGQFAALPDDFLVINDVALDVATVASVSVQTDTDMFIGEILRSNAPTVQSHGTGMDVVSVSVQFPNGESQTGELRRILAELMNHPFVFIENNRIRRALGYASSNTATMMFVLHSGSIRAGVGQVGLITLDLQLATFNYKPFSNHYWYNANLPGILSGDDEIPSEQNHGELLPGDRGGRPGYEFARSAFRDFAAERLAENPNQQLNTPVVYPSGSKAWMFYADQMESSLPVAGDMNRDYVGLAVTRYRLFVPPENARIGQGNLKDLFSSKDRKRTPSKFYDASQPPILGFEAPKQGQTVTGQATSNVEGEYNAIAGAIKAESGGGRVPHKAIALYIPYARKGRGEFKWEAINFSKKFEGGGKVKLVAVPESESKPETFEEKKQNKARVQGVTDAGLSLVSNVEVIAAFCHGYNQPPGLQMYPGGLSTVDKFVTSMSMACRPSVKVMLYACDCGRAKGLKRNDWKGLNLKESTSGSYAYVIRDLLMSAGKTQCAVYAHMTPGHTTRNPYLLVFTRPAGSPGRWIIEPSSRLWKKWFHMIHINLGHTLRYRLWKMTPEEIRAEVERYIIPPSSEKKNKKKKKNQ